MRKVVFFLLFLGSFFASLFVGSYELNVEKLFFDPPSQMILFELRLPRALLALLSGAILAMCGALFQLLFQNRLVTPYTLGVSSAATFGAGVAIKFGLFFSVFALSAVQLFAMLFGVGLAFVFLYLSGVRSLGGFHLLLVGIAFGLFFSSALMLLFFFGDPIANDMILRFSMGSLVTLGYREIALLGVAFALFIALLLFYKDALYLMSVSRLHAKMRGVEVATVELWLLVVATIVVALLVSITGPIGFVGLVVPNMLRLFVSVSEIKILFASAFFGAWFVLVCDTIARALSPQSELAVGVVTALLGGAFFIYLLLKKRT